MLKTILLLSCVLTACLLVGSIPLGAAEFDYPKPKQSDQKDEYFGTVVADPYRALENPGDPEVKKWIDEENAITGKYLAGIPMRQTLQKRITEIINYPKYSLPWTKNGRRFFFKNNGLQNQSVLYVLDTPDAEPRVLLDPNTLSEDGTVSLQGTAVSKNGKYLLYSLAKSGSDWNEIKVLEIETTKPLSDTIEWVKFSQLAWFGDGFYYSRYDAPPKGEELTAKNEFHKVYYHRLGTAQSEDRLVYENPKHPQRTCRAGTDKEERFLFLSSSESTYGNSLQFRDLTKEDAPIRTISGSFDSEIDVVAVIDNRILALTDRGAPNKRLIAIDPEHPEQEHWTDLIPESDSLLHGVEPAGGKLIVSYLKDAASCDFLYDLKGKKEKQIDLPTVGIASFSGDKDETEYFQSFTSFTYPTVIYRCDVNSDKRTELFPTPSIISPDDYITERVWYENKDGGKAPIFVTYKKGLQKNGNNPTLLYGYGGFNISMTPGFSATRIPFLENGGVYAVAILRGGGEYGENWYKAGTKLQKKNVFDDFAAAAEQLIKDQYTSPKKLAIQGGSNGGLLVGAAITRRPDLFKAAICAVGVLDMLRYQKFTIGWAWANDYGTSADSKEMFEYLLSYSPLHHVKSGIEYPALLVTTSDHDDRVVPAHSFKFTATMQEKNTGPNPVLIRIETKAGHGAGKPISKIIEESADTWAFLMQQLGMELK